MFLPASDARAQAPTIASFSPTTVCQGDVITITGTHFTGATAVTAGNNSAAGYSVNNDNTITATVSNISASGTITVTTPNGTATSTGTLSINPSPKPVLTDVGTLDAPFTNCDGNNTYQLKVSNSSSVSGTGNAYQISWGDNTPNFTQTDWAASAQTTHTYSSQGYFTITLTITPANGCTRSATYRFYNGKNPLASLTTTTSTTGLCAPAPVEFQIGNWFNNSAGTTYQIDFGDGSPDVTLNHPLNATGTIQLLSHTYTTTSCPNIDFKATLKAINGCYTTSYTLDQIIIRIRPTADFIAQPTPACITGPVCFTNQTINGYSGNICSTNATYSWDFGDGFTSTAQTPSCHTYSAAGTYNVTLTASNTACGPSTKTKQVIVLPTSPPPVVSAAPVVYCQGAIAAALTATGTGLLWYTSSTGGAGSSQAPVPPTNIPGTRIYYVSQTLTNECESPRVAITVTVNALPAAPGVVSPIQLCKNQVATPLTATGTGLLWYSAASGGTGSATAPTPSTSTIGSSTYYVSQTTNSCEGPRAAITVNVNDFPVAPSVVSPITYCQGQTPVPLTATGSGLLWHTTPTGGTGSSTAPLPSTAAPGTTTWYVSQTTGCGESPRAAIVVNVNASPSASILYTPSLLCNSSSSAPVTPVLTGSTGGSYSISPGTGLPIDAVTGVITPAGAASGVYTIRYSIPGTGGCGNFSTTATVTVNGTPNASIAYPSLCSSDAATAVRLSGTTGGSYTSTTGLTIDASTGLVTPASSTPGTYVVTYSITAAPPCPGFSTTTSLTITQAPSASISYSPASLCNSSSSTPITPTHTGSAGGSYTILPATGLPIDAVTGVITPAGATPGVYTIKYNISGTGGCSTYSTSTTVTINGSPAASISYPDAPFCRGIVTPQKPLLSGTAGGSYSADAGLSIDPATGAINPSTSLPGVYTVTYTIAAAAPCPGLTTTTTVEIDDSPVITFTTASQSICSGQTASFQPTSSVAGTTYQWSVVGALPANISGTVSGVAAGASPVITLSFTNTGAVSQTLTIRVSPASPAATPCPGTPYNLSLTINPIPPAPNTANFNFCMHDPAAPLAVSPLPGTTIKWYDNNLNPLPAAPVPNTATPAQFFWFITQSYGNGCESPPSKVTATVNPVAKIISSSYKNPTTCGIPTGSITLNLLDLDDHVIPNQALLVHYTRFQTSYTVAGSTDLNGKLVVPLTAGSYSGIFVEINGCSSQPIPDVFILQDPTPPLAPVAGYNPPVCNGTLLNLTALSATSPEDGPISYVWAGPAFGVFPDTVTTTVIAFPVASPSYGGTYVVYAMQNNCISPPTYFQVVIRQAPVKPVIVTRTPLCVGDNLNLQAFSSAPGPSNQLNFVWSGPGAGFPVNGPTAEIDNVAVSDAGIYSITVTSPQTGCSATTDTLIQIGGYPIVKFSEDSITLPTGFLLTLAPAITNAADPGILPIEKYTWTPAVDLTCNNPACSAPTTLVKDNTCYSVTATNIYGCSGRDTICAKVFCKSSQIFIPNAFTPKGDVQANRKLIVRASGISTVRSFRIFNRWGKIVFEKNNFPPNSPDFGWDGMVNGRPGDPGVYVYTAEVVCENGVPYTYKGNVTLL